MYPGDEKQENDRSDGNNSVCGLGQFPHGEINGETGGEQ
jgi:hypothetical protein